MADADGDTSWTAAAEAEEDGGRCCPLEPFVAVLWTHQDQAARLAFLPPSLPLNDCLRQDLLMVGRTVSEVVGMGADLPCHIRSQHPLLEKTAQLGLKNKGSIYPIRSSYNKLDQWYS